VPLSPLTAARAHKRDYLIRLAPVSTVSSKVSTIQALEAARLLALIDTFDTIDTYSLVTRARARARGSFECRECRSVEQPCFRLSVQSLSLRHLIACGVDAVSPPRARPLEH
jgi:hypothetical protein